MPGGGYTAPFEPQEQDVVSTKLRSWNLGHPGNLIYAELLVDYALKLPLPSDPNYSAILSETTKELVEDITMERGGRFLKIAEGENHPDDCVVMDFKACHHKVLHGLKNKQRVILTKGVPPKPVKKMEPPKKNEPFKAAPRRPKPKDPEAVVRTTKRVRKQRKFDDEGEEEGPKKRRRKRVKVYEATQREDGTINPYALELISFVCNNRSQPMLEKPGAQYSTPEEEPHHERQIRLQLRHRFFAAIAMKIEVLDFAKKLVEVWGGSLSETSVLVDRSELGNISISPSRNQGTRKAASRRNQCARGDSSDESVDASTPRRIPQKEPRRMAVPQKEPRRMSVDNAHFTSLLHAAESRLGGNSFGGRAGDAADDSGSSSDSSSSGSSSSDGSDSDGDSDSASDSVQERTPTYPPINGYGFYGMGNGGYQRANQSDSERSDGGSIASGEEERFQYYGQRTCDYYGGGT